MSRVNGTNRRDYLNFGKACTKKDVFERLQKTHTQSRSPTRTWYSTLSRPHLLTVSHFRSDATSYFMATYKLVTSAGGYTYLVLVLVLVCFIFCAFAFHLLRFTRLARLALFFRVCPVRVSAPQTEDEACLVGCLGCLSSHLFHSSHSLTDKLPKFDHFEQFPIFYNIH